MKPNKKLLLALTLLLAAVALSAQDKPNLSGTWELNVEKSNLDGAPITKLVVKVDHKDPVLTYTATGTAGGEDFSETETFTTDGKPANDSHGNVTRVHWDGPSLVFESEGAQGTDSGRLTISSDGKSMTRDYERKNPSEPQKRHEIYDKR
jgi:hypothetical protein